MQRSFPSPGMLVDCVDSNNRVVGTVTRREIFRGHCGFRTVHVFVFNDQGELLLQQQSGQRERAPLSWGSSVAAYLFAGETYEIAARRRLAQELGITPEHAHFVDVVRMDDLGHDKFVGLVTTECNGPFRIDKAHVQQVRFLPVSQILSIQKMGLMTFTPTFLSLLEFYTGTRGADSNSR